MRVVAALAAMLAGAGLWLTVTGARRWRPDAIDRALAGHPAGAVGSDAPAALDRVLAAWDERMGVVRRRGSLLVLRRADTEHRRRQGRWAVAGVVVAIVLVLREPSPAIAVWAALAVPSALLGCEYLLHYEAARCRDRLSDQVVPLSEFLALGATAGLTAAEGLHRAGAHLDEPMRTWVLGITSDVRSGRSLDAALSDAASAMAVPGFRRLTDTVLTSTSRGTPLATTLMAQVADCRSGHHARLLERAGRAEIAMLVPIVLLVLPAVVAVAVYPGFLSLLAM